ncbi:Zinc finger cchc domain-containing protein 8 [Plakobranchus ocellatus]|uniref:Zinc finger cchc domain-containing protein 8 n=1 Tax=Plakobranchus ocellatus TaxID=259542 RepID=A0AAV4DG08_9GAST|nr:Zinc finger cchc domain-containing protein 8 [Plakobranchus ocellatus]
MADVFGDLDLFSEFDKDREAQGSFIHYDEDTSRSRIIFEDFKSESEDESEEEREQQSDSKEQSVGSELNTGDSKNVDLDSSVFKTEEDGEFTERDGSNGDAEKANVAEPLKHSVQNQKLSSSTEDEKKVAWLNAQLYAEAAEEANKNNKSAQQLVYERNKYRRYAKILDSTRYTPDEDSPAVQLLFNNNSFARKYRQQIEQFIKGLLWEEFHSSKDTMSEITVKPGNPSCVEINSNLSPESRSERMRQKHALIGNSQFHKQFLIDSLGWPFNVPEPARCNVNWEIPLYGQVFNEVYADPSNKPKPSKGSKPKPACWNCGELNHAIMDCKKPKNYAKIAASKKEFMDQQGAQTPKFSGPSRYHLDPELASKFSRFKPGVLSESLREALGLSTDQLPTHIYKMRLYGYPPGWLAEAKQVQSGVTIFDKHGRVALITGECLEDGELDEDEESEAKQEYDVNKIIEYPGFTIPVPLGFHDEHAVFKMPPIQQHQLKKTLMSQSSDKSSTSKKRKRGKDKGEKKDGEAKKLKTSEDHPATDEAEDGEIADPVEDGESGESTKQQEVISPLERSASTISMSKDFGTPIFTRDNSSLPDASKFGKDIEEHIPFENLPNATGTFEKMKDLLDLIKKRTKKQS